MSDLERDILWLESEVKTMVEITERMERQIHALSGSVTRAQETMRTLRERVAPVPDTMGKEQSD